MNRVLVFLATALLAAALAGCDSTVTALAPVAPDATPAPALQTPAVSRPTRIRIPTLQVDANIIDLGLQSNGAMEVPPDAKDAGWYVNSPFPGLPGPAVLAAHVNWKGVDGPFAHIDQLKAGDQVVVEHDNGTTTTFAVTRVDTFAKEKFPADQVYADTAQPELVMITCGGRFDSAAHSYLSNVVVRAALVA